MADLAALIGAAGFRVTASGRMRGVYWSHVVCASCPPRGSGRTR